MPKVNWYTDRVLVKVNAASDKGLAAVAQQIAGQTKANIQRNGQIDTGFMLNSVYAASRVLGSDYAKALAAAQASKLSRKTGRVVRSENRMAPERQVEKDVAAIVVVGANYAVYQEIKKSFLYAAAEQVSGTLAGATIEAEARKELNE